MERVQPIDWAEQTKADLYCTWPGSQVTRFRPLLAGRDRTNHVCLGERHDLSDPNPQVHVLYLEKMVIQGYGGSSWEISSSSPGSCLRLLGSSATPQHTVLQLAQKPKTRQRHTYKTFLPPHALMPTEEESHWALTERSLGSSVEESHDILVFNKVVWFPSLVIQEVVVDLNIQYCHSMLLQEAKTCLSFITFFPGLIFWCHVYKVRY